MTNYTIKTFTQKQIEDFAKQWRCSIEEAKETLELCIVDQSC